MICLLEDTKPAKPHFRLAGGVWSCSTYSPSGWVMGFGYSVKGCWTDYVRHLTGVFP